MFSYSICKIVEITDQAINERGCRRRQKLSFVRQPLSVNIYLPTQPFPWSWIWLVEAIPIRINPLLAIPLIDYLKRAAILLLIVPKLRLIV